jgi:PAS domain S-box-containing protein
MRTGSVVVIGDDEAAGRVLSDALRARGFTVESAARGSGGFETVLARPFDAAIVEIKPPEVSGRGICRALKESRPDAEVIFIAEGDALATAIAAIGDDAFAYVAKPLAMEHLIATLEKALEKQELARALRESEERYRLIAENIQDAVVLLDLDGRPLYQNTRAEQISGYASDELRGRSILSLLTPEGVELVQARFAAARRGDEIPPVFEAEVIRKDGSRVRVEGSATTVMRGGRAVGRLGVLRDITERERVAERLRREKQFTDAAIDSLPGAFYLLDERGAVLRWNTHLERVTGFSGDEISRMNAHDFFAGDDRQLLGQRIGEVFERGHATLEADLVARDGARTRYFFTGARVVLDGRPRLVGMGIDISERRRAAEEIERQRDALHQTGKLAAMGELLAGVAHELNNPLSVVTGYAAIIRRSADARVAERAEKLLKAAERCARIVKNFLALARRRSPQRERIDLNRVVVEAMELLAYPLRVDGIEVVLDLARDLPVFAADPHQLHQVVVNLVSNAHQAMRETPAPRRLTISTRPGKHRRVVLEVADTGPGIAPDIRPRIFEPFFTTKPLGEGTGLGLSLCQSIVEAHDGTIRVASEPGRGAAFRIDLPVGEGTAPEPPPQAPDAPIRGGTILVVDDEPEIAGLLVDMLTADGHRVETAPNGVVALAKLGEQSYDLILSDLRMPELDGPGLYRELERRRPELLRRLIFITGDLLGPDTRAFVDRCGVPFLSKPFAFDEAHRVVQRALRELGSA